MAKRLNKNKRIHLRFNFCPHLRAFVFFITSLIFWELRDDQECMEFLLQIENLIYFVLTKTTNVLRIVVQYLKIN